ncbi:hypothetical protein MTR67_040149 [Solanum verrucosum]|uniref:Uncharacterized protein n=1 Tax=Solanum verrucosum TaxID=315347 RepID=A0AAF0UJ13_SOLVR|nr:hypothetical protein MTR67_040149 [Solanum verrucosum]
MTPVMAAGAVAKQGEHRKQDGNVLFQNNQFIAAIHAYTEVRVVFLFLAFLFSNF